MARNSLSFWVSTFLVFSILMVIGTLGRQEERSSPYSSYRESEHEVVFRETREAKGKSRVQSSECRYKKGPWADCDGVSNTQTRSLTLKRGDATCPQNKIITKKCKKACRYEKGQWSECQTGSRTRVDKLKSKSDSACEATKTITKQCKNTNAGANCRYERNVSWSDCDPGTGKKSKVMRLTEGSATECAPSKTLEKNCRKGKGGKSDDD